MPAQSELKVTISFEVVGAKAASTELTSLINATSGISKQLGTISTNSSTVGSNLLTTVNRFSKIVGFTKEIVDKLVDINDNIMDLAKSSAQRGFNAGIELEKNTKVLQGFKNVEESGEKLRRNLTEANEFFLGEFEKNYSITINELKTNFNEGLASWIGQLLERGQILTKEGFSKSDVLNPFIDTDKIKEGNRIEEEILRLTVNNEKARVEALDKLQKYLDAINSIQLQILQEASSERSPVKDSILVRNSLENFEKEVEVAKRKLDVLLEELRKNAEKGVSIDIQIGSENLEKTTKDINKTREALEGSGGSGGGGGGLNGALENTNKGYEELNENLKEIEQNSGEKTFQKIKEDVEETGEQIEDFTDKFKDNITSALDDTLKLALEGNFKDIGKLWKNVLSDMLSQFLGFANGVSNNPISVIMDLVGGGGGQGGGGKDGKGAAIPESALTKLAGSEGLLSKIPGVGGALGKIPVAGIGSALAGIQGLITGDIGQAIGGLIGLGLSFIPVVGPILAAIAPFVGSFIGKLFGGTKKSYDIALKGSLKDILSGEAVGKGEDIGEGDFFLETTRGERFKDPFLKVFRAVDQAITDTLKDISQAALEQFENIDIDLKGGGKFASGEKAAKNLQAFITGGFINPLFDQIKEPFVTAFQDIGLDNSAAERFVEAFDKDLTKIFKDTKKWSERTKRGELMSEALTAFLAQMTLISDAVETLPGTFGDLALNIVNSSGSIEQAAEQIGLLNRAVAIIQPGIFDPIDAALRDMKELAEDLGFDDIPSLDELGAAVTKMIDDLGAAFDESVPTTIEGITDAMNDLELGLGGTLPENIGDVAKQLKNMGDTVGDMPEGIAETTVAMEELVNNSVVSDEAFKALNDSMKDTAEGPINLSEAFENMRNPIDDAANDFEGLTEAMQLDPDVIAKFELLRAAIVKLTVGLAQSIGSITSFIDGLNSQIVGAGGTAVDTSQFTQTSIDALRELIASGMLTPDEELAALQQLSALANQQIAAQQAGLQAVIEQQQLAIRTRIDGLNEEKKRIQDAFNVRIDGLKEELKIAEQFKRLNEQIRADLDRLILGPNAPLTPQEQLGRLQAEIGFLRDAIPSLVGDEQLKAIDRLRGLSTDLFALGTDAFGAGSPESIAFFEQVTTELQDLLNLTDVRARTIEDISAEIERLTIEMDVSLKSIDATISSLQEQSNALGQQQIQISQETRELLEFIRDRSLVILEQKTAQLVELTAADGVMLDEQTGLMQTQLEKLREQIALQETGLEIDQRQADLLATIAEGIIDASPYAGLNNGVTVAAKGLHAFVDKPTLILAGEAGRERIDITPIDQLGKLSSLVAVGDGQKLDARMFSQLRDLRSVGDSPRTNLTRFQDRAQNNRKSEGTRPVTLNVSVAVTGSGNTAQDAKEIETALLAALRRGEVRKKLQQLMRVTQ